MGEKLPNAGVGASAGAASEEAEPDGIAGLPEAAVLAAAQAIFHYSVRNHVCRDAKARMWLTDAPYYRGIARMALSAALPHLKDQAAPPSPA